MNAIKEIPELSLLLSEVEKHYGRPVRTTTDFEALSVVIERETGDLISSSTLKRLWGYVTLKPKPRISTLDILARFIGISNFNVFCETIRHSNYSDSSFFSAYSISANEMETGDRLQISWNPNRIVILEYLGDCSFKVLESINSQLRPGDVFTKANFIQGYPMYVTGILRDGNMTDPYIAGSESGLTGIESLK